MKMIKKEVQDEVYIIIYIINYFQVKRRKKIKKIT